MNAVSVSKTEPTKAHAAQIAEHFRSYNEEFGRLTRRAALNFLAEDWQSAQADAVARIELYDQRVTRCVVAIGEELHERRRDVALWSDIKRAYEMLVARRPDSDFYRTFFNSVSRELFGTVGVNTDVEFCATNVGRASGAVPIRVYRIGSSLPTAVREIIADLPFGAAINDPDAAVHRISAEIGRYFESGRQSGAPESIELIEPVFYRGMHAFAVGRIIGDSSITPLVVAFSNSGKGVQVDAVMLSCRSSARPSRCCARSCPASPSMSSTRSWAGPSRERRSAISPCSGISARPSTASFTHRATGASS